jgi:hypothetical protein
VDLDISYELLVKDIDVEVLENKDNNCIEQHNEYMSALSEYKNWINKTDYKEDDYWNKLMQL